MCWFLFNLAVFALPFLVGLRVGTWGLRQLSNLARCSPRWWLCRRPDACHRSGVDDARPAALSALSIALISVVVAVLAGFNATLGITRAMMPSETWQVVFAVIGAGAMRISAFLCIAGSAAAPSDRSTVSA
ncbi:hypothetical protein [Roseibium aggregatum]|uniref:hypothetical protein n=1 Tax=Roseibium aggregatum TaxID=187304 RepID=UPI002E2C8DCD|nr:hypothetical protein [Roseibium aggregatum]